LRGLASSQHKLPIRIFGDGPTREHLANLAWELGVQATIAPSDDPSEIAAALAGAIYIHARSTIGDGFPTAILEALASRAFVVSPRFEAAGDYLVTGVNCLFYE